MPEQKPASLTAPVDYAHNGRARANRAAKAYRLADELEEFGRLPTVEERRAILRELGIRAASDETWAMAVEIYMERHPGAR